MKSSKSKASWPSTLRSLIASRLIWRRATLTNANEKTHEAAAFEGPSLFEKAQVPRPKLISGQEESPARGVAGLSIETGGGGAPLFWHSINPDRHSLFLDRGNFSSKSKVGEKLPQMRGHPAGLSSSPPKWHLRPGVHLGFHMPERCKFPVPGTYHTYFTDEVTYDAPNCPGVLTGGRVFGIYRKLSGPPLWVDGSRSSILSFHSIGRARRSTRRASGCDRRALIVTGPVTLNCGAR